MGTIKIQRQNHRLLLPFGCTTGHPLPLGRFPSSASASRSFCASSFMAPFASQAADKHPTCPRAWGTYPMRVCSANASNRNARREKMSHIYCCGFMICKMYIGLCAQPHMPQPSPVLANHLPCLCGGQRHGHLILQLATPLEVDLGPRLWHLRMPSQAQEVVARGDQLGGLQVEATHEPKGW